MTLRNLKGAGATLALTGMICLSAQPALAQMVPQAAAQDPQPQQVATGGQQEEEVVFISNYIEACRPTAAPGTAEYQQQLDDCAWPSASTESDFRGDSRRVTREQFFARWPNAGQVGWAQALSATDDLCSMARETWSLLQSADEQLAQADLTLQDLEAIYAQLPREVRNATRVMLVSQAVSTGALCVLSAGLYCIAAAATLVGNFFTGRMNQRLQLVHIRLAVVNIAVTRANIVLQRIHIRLTTAWMDYAMPACFRRDNGVGWEMPGISGSGDVTRQPLALSARW